MNLQNLLILTVVSIVSGVENHKISDVIPCTFAEIDKCILRQSPLILHAIQNGVPSLGIPSFNPYHIDHLRLPSVESIKIDLSDVDIFGVPDAEIRDLRVKYRKRRGFLEAYFKRLTISAQYRVNGTYIVSFQNATGNVIITLEGVSVDLDAKFKVNKKLLDLSDVSIDLQLKHFEVDGTSDGTNDGQVWILRDYINRNWKMLFKKYKEYSTMIMEEITVPILTKIGNALLFKLLTLTRRKSRDF